MEKFLREEVEILIKLSRELANYIEPLEEVNRKGHDVRMVCDRLERLLNDRREEMSGFE